jgi:ribonuclease HII
MFDEYRYIQTLKDKNYSLFVCDEVGRGPLAGPVVSCSLYIPSESLTDEFLDTLEKLGVGDSKKVTQKKRQKIIKEIGFNYEKLEANEVYSFELMGQKAYFLIGQKKAAEIDELNILKASLLSMKEGCERIIRNNKITSQGIILIDGNQKFTWPNSQFAVVSLIKGDKHSKLIGLASIIAKEFRDFQMELFDEKYPGYGFASHCGYPTKAHKQAITELGILPIHRHSFKGVKEHVEQR